MTAPLCAWCGCQLPVGEADDVEDGGLCEASEERIRESGRCGWIERKQEVESD